jgi:predicted RNase H-like HicB family nuclease
MASVRLRYFRLADNEKAMISDYHESVERDAAQRRAALTVVSNEREDDGRWLAEVPGLSGVLAYGQDRNEAVARVQALALRVIAERLEHREAPAEFVNVTFEALGSQASVRVTPHPDSI